MTERRCAIICTVHEEQSPGGGGAVLNRSLGREVRPGDSNTGPVKTQFSDFPIPFKTEFVRHLTQNHTLFKTKIKQEYTSFSLYFNALAITIYLRHYGITELFTLFTRYGSSTEHLLIVGLVQCYHKTKV